MNYLDKMKEKGFTYADNLSSQELTNLELLLSIALQDMTVASEDENHLFCIAPNYENYQVTITDKSIDCTSMLHKKTGRFSNREFSIYLNSAENDFVFTAINMSDDGIIFIRIPITADAQEIANIMGYGKDLRILFDEFMDINMLAIPYEDMFNIVTKEYPINPDICRVIRIKRDSRSVTMEELDVIPEEPVRISTISLADYSDKELVTILASYLSMKDYLIEIKAINKLKDIIERQEGRTLEKTSEENKK